MLRATDDHAKNSSIFLCLSGTYELTPLYDVLSAYPVISTGANQLSPFKAKMAMAVRSKNTHWAMRDIVRRHWLEVGKEHGVVAPDGRGTEVVLDEIVEQTPEVVRSVRALLPEKFPKHVADSILNELPLNQTEGREGLLDTFSSQVLGCLMESRMSKNLVLQALLATVWRHKPKQTVMVHSDQSNQFTSYE